MSSAAPDVAPVEPAATPGRRARVQKQQPGYLIWWLCLALFFEYARPANFVPAIGALPLNSVIPLSLLLVCLFNGSLRPWGEIFNDRSSRWITVYMVLIFLTVFTSVVNFTSWLVFQIVLGYFFLFIIFARVLSSQADIMKVVGTLVFAHIFLLLMNFNVLTDPSQRQYIVGGTFLGDGNDYSMSLCLLMPLALELALRAKTLIPRGLAWGSIGLMLLAVVASQSRGAVLGLGAVAVYLWWRSKNKVAGVVVAMLLGIGLMIYAPGVFFDRMGTIAQYETEGSAQARISAWKAGMRMVIDRPLTGVGAGMFAPSYGTKYKPKGEWVHWANAHSIYFLVIGELGVPGIVTLLVVLWGGMFQNERLRKRFLEYHGDRITPEQVVTARLLLMGTTALIGFAIAGAFLSAAYYPHLFVLTGTMVALRSMVEKTLPPDPAKAGRGRARRRVSGPGTSAAPPGGPASDRPSARLRS
jgi:putative inorganic carbon (HCO3(-)) transporter